MTQKSALWTTGSAGDGSVKFSRNDWARIMKILAACSGYQGIAPGYLNNLAGTVTGANAVSIDTGGAVVDGISYLSDAPEAVAIPSAVGAGSTRIDRIVLRADWTAQTVRITRIAGIDAASPSAPAITQSAGNMYDLPLYQALVNTAGAVTLTDERQYAGALLLRQGGNAANWDQPGTTNYTPGPSLKRQIGAVTVTINPNWTTGVISVTFPQPFTAKPIVQVSIVDPSSFGTGADYTPFIRNLTTTGMDIHIERHGNYDLAFALTLAANWSAEGPA